MENVSFIFFFIKVDLWLILFLRLKNICFFISLRLKRESNFLYIV